MVVQNDYPTALLLKFYRGDFDIMDDHDHTANVSTFHQLHAACEQILLLRFDKKHKRYLYCLILWSKLQICSWYILLLTGYCKSCYLCISTLSHYCYSVL